MGSLTEITFYRPVATLPVSLTGGNCALNCTHCGGHYLKKMAPVDGAFPSGITSLLVSGGCNGEGRVPLWEQRRKLQKWAGHYRLLAHTGLIPARQAAELAQYCSGAAFDLPASDRVVREVYGLPFTRDDYLKCLRNLNRYLPVHPHLCLGLWGEGLRAEYDLVEILAAEKLTSLIILIFTPTPGTVLAARKPPHPQEVFDFLQYARHKLAATRLIMGCMRPGGGYRRRLDPLAVAAGVDGVVQPAPAAVTAARDRGYVVRWGEECCCLD